ncbi:MAG: type II toxin-antitoxin system Phd/YefM family antitoxin [Planctomycetota bacterium]|nr:MAG: type II toxin-antitoxin system Phd/YefM family antitoxin [Planctomycetota bacterium]
MISLHPNILEKDGKKAFAVLPFEEFLQIQDELQDFEDLKSLREAKEKEKNVAGLGLSQARKELKI